MEHVSFPFFFRPVFDLGDSTPKPLGGVIAGLFSNGLVQSQKITRLIGTHSTQKAPPPRLWTQTRGLLCSPVTVWVEELVWVEEVLETFEEKMMKQEEAGG